MIIAAGERLFGWWGHARRPGPGLGCLNDRKKAFGGAFEEQ